MNGERHMKTLITGGTGLIGRAISGDVKLSTRDGDLRTPSIAMRLFNEHKPQYVVHCAGKVGGVGANDKYKGQFYYDNIMINTNVLEAARRVGVLKLVSFLSTCIFPDVVELPLDETKIHLGEPHKTNYAYAYSKRMLDIQSMAYRDEYGCNFVCVIPTNCYGPDDNFDIQSGHAIPSLIHKCFLAKRNNTPLEVWGTGDPIREFIYVDDVARLTEWVLHYYNEKGPIILSASDPISIKKLVKLIAQELQFDGKILWDYSKPDGQYRKPSCNNKLMGYLPNFKFTNIHEGLKKTISWFVENYDADGIVRGKQL